MIFDMKSLLPILLLACAASPAAAAETDWMEVAPDVSVRLVSSDIVSAENTVWMGLEIDMPQTTKTYWRVPGESGIPMVIDTAGSRGVAGLEIAWPYPRRETAGGYLDHAFYGRVLFPLAVSVDAENPLLVADITMGVCSDICVPATARLELAPTLADPDSANDFRIRQALATVPLPHDGEGLLGSARFDAEKGALLVELDDPGFDPASMIAEIAESSLIFGEPRVSPDETALSFPLLGRIAAGDLARAEARFTFDTPQGPFEIVRPLSGQ